jgi:Ca2+/H+ antiporter, TMEM165/GDT1 family
MITEWTHKGPAVTAAFLGSLVEFIEALTIVIAVGTVRGWRSAMFGTSMGGAQGARLFVDDGSLAVSILVSIVALHVVAPIAFVERRWSASVLFFGCAGILIENVLYAARQPLPSREAARHNDVVT